MKRRDLTNLMGLGLLSSSLPVAIAACQADSTQGGAGGNDGFVSLGTVADLDAQGALANGDVQGKNVAVIRDPKSPGAVVAVSAVCTHAGCTVALDSAQGVFVCPCHGGRFNADGTVNSGPTRQPLGTFEAKIDGDRVLVKV